MSSGHSPVVARPIWARTLGTAGLRYASLIVGFALSIVIARVLGPEGRGQYYYPILVALTLQAFLQLGLDPANVFLFSQRRLPYQDLVTQSGAFALLTGATGVVAGLAGWFFLRDSLMSGVPLAHFVLVLAPLPATLHAAYLTGLLLLKGRAMTLQGITLVGSIVQLTMMGALVLAPWTTVSVGAVLAVNGLTLILTWGLTLGVTASLASVRPRWLPHVAVPALRFGVRLHLTTILYFLVMRLDAYLVKPLLGLTALGYYSLALSLVDLVTVATDALTASVLPRQAALTLDEAASLTAKTCRVNLALATLLSLGLALAAYPMIAVAYGRAFVPSIIPLLWLLPGTIIGSVTKPLGYYLVRLDRPYVSVAIVGLGLIVSVTANLALIPSLGVAGAAIAASACAAVLAGCSLAWFLRQSGLPLGQVLWLRAEDLAGIRAARTLAGFR